MSKTERATRLGVFLPIMEQEDGVRSWSEIKAMAKLAEDVGFDSIWGPDHFLYQLEDDSPPRGSWEVWSMLCAIAACTDRISLGTLVLGMGFRNPALLAKMADTLDEISGGRLILGIGAGYHQLEYEAFGFPFDYKYSRFEEGLKILHGLLRDSRVDFHGRYSSAAACEIKPRGPTPGGPPLMIGSKGPKMMKLMARYCDSWNGFWDDVNNSPAGYAKLKPVLDAACEEAGRDPETLGRSVTVLLADESDDPWWKEMPFPADVGQLEPLMGHPEQIAASLHEFADLGVDSIQLHVESLRPGKIELLAPVLQAFDAG